MKIISIILAVLSLGSVRAQNVGIGTSLPFHRVTVLADVNGNGVVAENVVQTGFYTNPGFGGVLKTLNNYKLTLATNNSSLPAVVIGTDRNIGIGLGNNLPAFKLDAGGRMRLQYQTANALSAGIWLDGSSMQERSFLGMINDTHIGLFGGGGAGWNIAMNVGNGNTGIGTFAPSAKLDVNGQMRIRTSGLTPKIGSVLTSLDASGNAVWQYPVAFHASSCAVDSFVVPANTWTKFIFSLYPEYNSGVHYQAAAAQFVVPFKGIYHLASQAQMRFRSATEGIALRGSRNGSPFTVGVNVINHGGVSVSGTLYQNEASNNLRIDTEVLLEAGDIIWMELYSTVGNHLFPYASNQWFTGYMITRL